MIQEYVNKLIDNLPNDFKERKIKIDLVLNGGLFNGSYMIGALYFLKEMERRKYIQVERISGASIGSIAGLLYLSDSLDKTAELYNIIFNELKTNHTLKSIHNIQKYLQFDYTKLNNRLYVSYINIENRKKCCKSIFKSNDDVCEAIVKSAHLPFITDDKLLYKGKYLDGINPYMFKPNPKKKILHLSCLGYDKIFHIFNVKNEKTNYHRLLAGLLDIHSFYIKQSPTPMCSYVNEWTIIDKTGSNIKFVSEQIIVFVICILKLVGNRLKGFDQMVLYKIISRTMEGIFGVLLETYCL